MTKLVKRIIISISAFLLIVLTIINIGVVLLNNSKNKELVGNLIVKNIPEVKSLTIDSIVRIHPLKFKITIKNLNVETPDFSIGNDIIAAELDILASIFSFLPIFDNIFANELSIKIASFPKSEQRLTKSELMSKISATIKTIPIYFTYLPRKFDINTFFVDLPEDYPTVTGDSHILYAENQNFSWITNASTKNNIKATLTLKAITYHKFSQFEFQNITNIQAIDFKHKQFSAKDINLTINSNFTKKKSHISSNLAVDDSNSLLFGNIKSAVLNSELSILPSKLELSSNKLEIDKHQIYLPNILFDYQGEYLISVGEFDSLALLKFAKSKPSLKKHLDQSGVEQAEINGVDIYLDKQLELKQAEIDIENFSVKPYNNEIGARNVSGILTITDIFSFKLRVKDKPFELWVPKTYDHPLKFSKIDGSLNFTIKDNLFSLVGYNIDLVAPPYKEDITLKTIKVDVVLVASEKDLIDTKVYLDIGAQNLESIAVLNYLPKDSDKELLTLLRDNLSHKGKINGNVKIDITKDTKTQKLNILYDVDALVKVASLKKKELPPLTNLTNAQISVNNDLITVSIDKGQVQGLNLKNIKFFLKDYMDKNQALMNLGFSINGEFSKFASFKDFLWTEPVGYYLGNLPLVGQMNADIKLLLPFYKPKTSNITYDANFKADSLAYAKTSSGLSSSQILKLISDNLALNSIKTNINYSSKSGLNVKNLSFNVFDTPAKVDIVNYQTHQLINASFDTDFVAFFTHISGLDFNKQLSVSKPTAHLFSLSIFKKHKNTQEIKTNLKINLTEPMVKLGKFVKLENEPFIFKSSVNLSLDQEVSMNGKIQTPETYILEKQDINFKIENEKFKFALNSAPSSIDFSGILKTKFFSEAEAFELYNIARSIQNKSKNKKDKRERKEKIRFNLSVPIKNISYGFYKPHSGVYIISNLKSPLALEISSALYKGNLSFENDTIEAFLFDIKKTDTPSRASYPIKNTDPLATISPQELPNINFKAMNIELSDNLSLDSISIVSNKEPHAYNINLEAKAGLSTARNVIYWEKNGKISTTTHNIEASISKFSTDLYRVYSGNIEAHLEHKGSFLELANGNFSTLNADIKTKLENLQISDVKLKSLELLGSLALILNFSQFLEYIANSSSKFIVEYFYLETKVKNGIASITPEKPLFLLSPVFKFYSSGDINFVNQTVNQEAFVDLNVETSPNILNILIAIPTLGANWWMEKNIDAYRIYGRFDDIKNEKISKKPVVVPTIEPEPEK